MPIQFPEYYILTSILDDRVTAEQRNAPCFNELSCFLSAPNLYKNHYFQPNTSCTEGNDLRRLLQKYADYWTEALSTSDEVIMHIMHNSSNLSVLTIQVAFRKNGVPTDALVVFNYNPSTGMVSQGDLGGFTVVM